MADRKQLLLPSWCVDCLKSGWSRLSSAGGLSLRLGAAGWTLSCRWGPFVFYHSRNSSSQGHILEQNKPHSTTSHKASAHFHPPAYGWPEQDHRHTLYQWVRNILGAAWTNGQAAWWRVRTPGAGERIANKITILYLWSFKTNKNIYICNIYLLIYLFMKESFSIRNGFGNGWQKSWLWFHRVKCQFFSWMRRWGTDRSTTSSRRPALLSSWPNILSVAFIFRSQDTRCPAGICVPAPWPFHFSQSSILFTWINRDFASTVAGTENSWELQITFPTPSF